MSKAKQENNGVWTPRLSLSLSHSLCLSLTHTQVCDYYLSLFAG